jgi:hypothetical protein
MRLNSMSIALLEQVGLHFRQKLLWRRTILTLPSLIARLRCACDQRTASASWNGRLVC